MRSRSAKILRPATLHCAEHGFPSQVSPKLQTCDVSATDLRHVQGSYPKPKAPNRVRPRALCVIYDFWATFTNLVAQKPFPSPSPTSPCVKQALSRTAPPFSAIPCVEWPFLRTEKAEIFILFHRCLLLIIIVLKKAPQL